jgi:hypothetical protein
MVMKRQFKETRDGYTVHLSSEFETISVQVFNPFGSTTCQKCLIELKRRKLSIAIAGHNR